MIPDLGGRDNAGTLLRALPGGAAGVAPPVDECQISRVGGRAGDRNEPWTLNVTESLRALARLAAARGVDLGVAARLTVELALVRRDLIALGVELDPLNVLADEARVDTRLDASAASYLRCLTQPRSAPQETFGDSITLGLPLRLTSRLLSVDIGTLIMEADLDQAIAWETAAVLAGRTMGEWAALAALTTTVAATSSG